jgi:phosphate uptake regulator
MSQRAIDYSIKAYELRRPEFCRHVLSPEHEFAELHRGLEDRCRNLLVAGLPVDSDSRFLWSALRICSALCITHAAAAEIAQTVMFLSCRRRRGTWISGAGRDVYGQVDDGIAQGPEDHEQGVGGVPGRFSADAG